MKEERTAWAIDRNYTDLDGKIYHDFIGIFMFANDLPEYQDMRPCIFKTQKIARKYLKEHKRGGQFDQDAQIVRVKVTVEGLI